MVRFTHADSDGDDLDEEDIEGDEEDCDDDPKKVGRKTPSRGTRCQKYVALDACFTKNKKYPTQLFIATTIDVNSQVVPLAYAVAQTENYENWRWFIQNLVASIEGLESRNVIIVSDRQKGLEKVVAEVLPRNFHMHCAHHLKMNVIKHFGAAAGKTFLTLVYMDSQASYERRLVEMETRSSKGPDLVRYIRQIPVDRYIRFAIPLPRYGRTTSNIVECINGALKPMRMRHWCKQMGAEAMALDESANSEVYLLGDPRFKTIPVILQTELPMSVACRAPPAAIRNGRQRIVRIPNGGSGRSAESEYNYPIQDDTAMNQAAVMTNVSQEDAGERGNPPVP
ncbi:hypothetical protein R1sor_020277 [Riccia sorocarpa]|uniref:MULE transposase domain-containing protein n=1 Tax=Riccia sorocarpa TaxID=122646 RepID=A0ABD3IEV1_9MARC